MRTIKTADHPYGQEVPCVNRWTQGPLNVYRVKDVYIVTNYRQAIALEETFPDEYAGITAAKEWLKDYIPPSEYYY